jgi:Protein of unknown function (DUF2852)
MTYDTQASGHPFNRDGDYLGWAKSPGFNMPKLLAVLAGFAIFPPLGIAALIYFLWNSRRHYGHGSHGSAGRGGCGRRGSTGNAAFDEHRAEVLRGLEEERQAFRAHRAEERRKRDAEALDAFRAAQKAAKNEGGAQS